MKTFVILLIVSLPMMIACGITSDTTGKGPEGSGDSLEIAASDSLEYELVIFDVNFNTWYMMNSRPMGAYEQSYLERWNEQLVHQWNNFSPGRQGHDCRPMSYIDYDPNVDYGMELNHQLFYYFKYMQQRCRVFYSRPGKW